MMPIFPSNAGPNKWVYPKEKGEKEKKLYVTRMTKKGIPAVLLSQAP